MSAKKVTCGIKPTPQAPAAASADQWVVASRTPETIKRFTLDIPASLHMRIKSTCALRGVKMAGAIRKPLATYENKASQ